MDIKVSVVIAVYNEEKYLDICIQSVLKQTYSNYEIILVNDGSTDNSEMILRNYELQYPDKIKVITKKNGGLSSARNEGMKHVTGEYVTFLDADDYLDEEYIETLINAAIDNNSDMVCSGQYKVEESGEIIKKIYFPAKNGQCLTRRLNISGKIYRTKYLKKWDITFPEGKLYEDNSFNLQSLFLSKNIFFLSYAGYYQVVHEGSITSKPIDVNKLPLAEWERCIKKIIGNHEEMVDMQLFEFTILSFFTYFLLVRNRKREYLQNGKEKKQYAGVNQIANYFQTIVNTYFKDARKNKYAKIFKYRELAFVQRIGVKIFSYLCYFKKLEGFTRIFYKVVG